MSRAGSILRRVQLEFKNYGVSNEVRIAEHVAFLLLVHDKWDSFRLTPQDAPAILNRLQEEQRQQYSSLTLPVAPSLGIDALFGVLPALEAAVSASPYGSDLGYFFQREIRFELLKATSGSQYPTPHHVAMLMAQLAVTDQTVNVLDPTAGTAGLLIAAHGQNPNAKLVGIDFDPQWVGLASANLILNNATNAQMETRQATSLYEDSKYAGQFDSVLMNPPFGGSRSPNDAWTVGGGSFGRTTSTLLAALALHMLKPNGISAFLQPSGTLFGSGGEARLRRVLMRDYQLEAVITLPPDAMQPYSQVATHLIIARKAQPSNAVWFISLTNDGYREGTSRDLTEEPIADQNELPRARDLVVATRQNRWQTRLILGEIGEVQTVKLGEVLTGLGIRFTRDSRSIKWNMSHLTEGVLVKIRNAEGDFKGWFYEPYGDGDPLNFSTDQAKSFNWKAQINPDNWTTGVPTSWQAGSDSVTVEVNAEQRKITLQRDRAKFEFSTPDNNANLSVIACLLNAEGQPLTPWLTITDQRQQGDIQSAYFGESVGATSISDATGNGIGWLLDLTMTSDNQEQQSTLLMVFSPECDLFRQDDGTTYALTENGWLEIQLDGTLDTQNGSPVRLRDDITQGFAIGPAPITGEAGYSLFGVLVPASVFVDGDTVGDMRPSRFLPEPEATPLGHPLDVLANIRRSQTRLSGKVDSLLGILGQSGRYDESTETLADIPDWIEAMLSNQQRQLLGLLKRQLVGDKPRHFNELDVVAWCEPEGIMYSVDDLQQQLRLFMRLGLVKPVHTKGHNLYRMITKADIQQAAEETQ